MRFFAFLIAMAAIAGGSWYALKDSPGPMALVPKAQPAFGLYYSDAKARPDILLLAVLTRVYEAFEEEDEGRVYDALASVAAKPVLEELYLQKQQSLITRLNGVRQSLHALELEGFSNSNIPSEMRLDFDARWRVVGTVGDATHKHVRGNSYAAKLSIQQQPHGDWHITEFALLSINRQDAGDITAILTPETAAQEAPADGSTTLQYGTLSGVGSVSAEEAEAAVENAGTAEDAQ